MNDATTPGAEQTGPVGFGEALARIGRVLFAPASTFASIARRPGWALALLVLCSTTLVVKLLVEPRIDPESLGAFLEERGLPADKIDEAVEQQLSPSGARRYVGIVTALGGAGLFYVLTAAVFFAGARLFGGEIDFRRALATTVHGLLPFLVATLVAIPVILSRESISFRETFSGNFLASHAGVFAGEEAGAMTQALLSSVDLFSIWCIVLLVIGFATVARLSRGAAVATVLVPWLIGIAIKVGFAALLGGG
jgi:hypothetical protein